MRAADVVAVHEGAALLDLEVPGWWRRITADHINMDSPANCVLGQYYGGYEHGLSALGLTVDNAWKYGFDIECEREFYHNSCGCMACGPPCSCAQRYRDLAEAWRAEIALRSAVPVKADHALTA